MNTSLKRFQWCNLEFFHGRACGNFVIFSQIQFCTFSLFGHTCDNCGKCIAGIILKYTMDIILQFCKCFVDKISLLFCVTILSMNSILQCVIYTILKSFYGHIFTFASWKQFYILHLRHGNNFAIVSWTQFWNFLLYCGNCCNCFVWITLTWTQSRNFSRTATCNCFLLQPYQWNNFAMVHGHNFAIVLNTFVAIVVKLLHGHDFAFVLGTETCSCFLI